MICFLLVDCQVRFQINDFELDAALHRLSDFLKNANEAVRSEEKIFRLKQTSDLIFDAFGILFCSHSKLNTNKKSKVKHRSTQTKSIMSDSSSPTTITAAPNVNVSSHPILSHKISILRSSATKPSAFRSVLRELTFHLGYEATANLETKPVTLTVPVGHDHVECTGKKIANQVALVPILRSGLGMVDAMLELLPNAAVHHIGMYRRDKMPVQYYNRLPKKCDADVAFIVDPLIATSNTVMSVIGILKKVRFRISLRTMMSDLPKSMTSEG
jgi:uracil phosphoribosyltransferase